MAEAMFILGVSRTAFLTEARSLVRASVFLPHHRSGMLG
jgi:hypothetical protein